MTNPQPQLAAHKGPRGEILIELKRAQPLTAKDLAERLGVSANAIRHHMKELEAESLCRLSDQTCGIGAGAGRCRGVCAGEAQFLQAVLGGTVDRRTHIVSGCNACEYAITFPSSPEPREPS